MKSMTERGSSVKIVAYYNNKWSYSDGARTQEELQAIAKKAFETGTVKKIKSGVGLRGTETQFEVIFDFAPMKYLIKIDCGVIEEIIEFTYYG